MTPPGPMASPKDVANATQRAVRTAAPKAPSGPVEAFLQALPAPERKAFARLVDLVRSCAPGAVEVVSYGMPALAWNGKAIAGFAAAREHLSFFPMSGGVLEPMAERLEGMDWSKGTLRFTLDAPIPGDLVKAIVKARMAEVAAGTAAPS